MHHVFQAFVDTLSRSPDVGALLVAMERTAAAFDLNRFAYLLSPHETTAKLISNYPVEWTDRYLALKYDRIDPVISTALRTSEPFQWGHGLWPLAPAARQNELLEEAAIFGIRCGFTFPIHDGASRFAAVTFAADQCPTKFRRCFEVHRQVLHLLAVIFHAEARKALAPGRTVAGVTISPRELECLQWAAKGKSAWDIGQILGISRRTAAFHLDNAKMKLGVRTVPQAVALLAASTKLSS